MTFIEKVKNIKKGKKDIIIGSWINSVSPIISEILSSAGFDFLCIDAEHSAIDYYNTVLLLQAIKAGNPNCAPIIRMQGNNYADTKRYLDAGALGVIAPLINSKSEAEYLIESVKYPPVGKRGVGFGRSHGYGFDFNNYMKFAEDNLFTAIQIEHIDAINNLEDILSVEGIDAVFIGPYDLTASMGITAEFHNESYMKVIEHINQVCQEKKIISGIHVVEPSVKQVIDRYKEGYNLIAYSLDITILGTNVRKAIKQIYNEL